MATPGWYQAWYCKQTAHCVIILSEMQRWGEFPWSSNKWYCPMLCWECDIMDSVSWIGNLQWHSQLCFSKGASFTKGKSIITFNSVVTCQDPIMFWGFVSHEISMKFFSGGIFLPISLKALQFLYFGHNFRSSASSAWFLFDRKSCVMQPQNMPRLSWPET